MYASDPLNNNLEGSLSVTSSNDITRCWDVEVDLTRLSRLAYKGYAQEEEKGLMIESRMGSSALAICIDNVCGNSTPGPQRKYQYANRVDFILGEVVVITASNPTFAATDAAGHIVELRVPVLHLKLNADSTAPNVLDREGLRD
jgi:hypothetical protein